ncbi:MAG: hypothetical protein ACOYMF_05235 [Bacteroidales bacterium]
MSQHNAEPTLVQSDESGVHYNLSSIMQLEDFHHQEEFSLRARAKDFRKAARHIIEHMKIDDDDILHIVQAQEHFVFLMAVADAFDDFEELNLENQGRRRK